VDSELASLAGEISPYAAAAVRSYGGAVLASARDQAGDATAGLGRRMLQRIFGTCAEGQLPDPVADLAADPGDLDLQAVLRVVITKMLAADPVLPGDLRGMLAGAPAVTVPASGDSTASNDNPPSSEQMRAGRAKEPARGFRQWSLDHKFAFATIVLSFIGVIAAAAIPPLLTGNGNSGSGSTVQNKTQIKNNRGGEFDNGGNINNYNASGTALSKDPEQRIVQLTGFYTDQGFEEAIFDRNTTIVALYLESGMTAATLYNGTSAILYGFEEVDQNNDPIQSGGAVALVKTFQANGYKINEELQDSYLMRELTGGLWPGMFDTPLTPKGYTGGYQDGTFVGSLLFWIVQRALGWGPTAEDIQVIHYLVSQGADCNVPLSFLKYAISAGQLTADETQGLLPIMQSCAK